MTEDLTRLRETMAALAEHGGETDLYDRALRTSARMGRRRTIAAAAAVLAVAAPIALAERYRGSPAPVVQTVMPSPSPTTAAPPSTSPSPVTSPSTAGSASSSKATVAHPCPVGPAALRRVAELPAGYGIDASTIECWRTWAIAGLTFPPGQHGDGVMIFRYVSGKWTKVGEGSALDCARDLGLPKGAAHPSWCTYHSVS